MPDTLRLTDEAEVEDRLTDAVVGSTGHERIAELIRIETLAAGGIQASQLLARVGRKTTPSSSNAAELEHILSALLRVGDVLEGPQRIIRPAPTRIVELGRSSWLLFGSISSRLVCERAGVGVRVRHGVPRRLSVDDTKDFVPPLDSLSGVVENLETWAGFEQRTSAEDFLAEISRQGADPLSPRLTWTSNERAEYLHFQLTTPWRYVWRVDPSPNVRCLVRLPSQTGKYAYGLLGVAASGAAIKLTPDEHKRCAYLLAAEQGAPVPCAREQNINGSATLRFPLSLPGAEYRMLSALRHGGRLSEGWEFTIEQQDRDRVEDLLSARLALTFIGATSPRETATGENE